MEAGRVIKSLNRMVVEYLDTPYRDVATQFWQRVSMDLQKAGQRFFKESGSWERFGGKRDGCVFRFGGAPDRG